MKNKTEKEIEILNVLGSYKIASNLIAVLEGLSFGITTKTIKPLQEDDTRHINYMIEDCKEQLEYISAHMEILKKRAEQEN